jgi:aminoglycoside phosphotransferase
MTLETQTDLGSLPPQVVDLSAVNNPFGVDGLNRGNGSCLFLVGTSMPTQSPLFISDVDQHLLETKGSSPGIINPLHLYFYSRVLKVLDHPPVLYARVVTGSERNLIRLRIWLACRVYRSFGEVGVYRFAPRSVLKFTPATRTAEAANIEYITRNTTIPVPRVQDVFIINQRTYIIMDYINGFEFSQKALSPEQREGIFEELKGYIAQMRALKPTRSGRVESADGSGLFDTRLGSRPFPPFESIEKFHSHIGHDVILNSDEHRKAWPQFQAMGNRQYCTKFTHSDIAPRNILVNNGKIAGIIDWEMAGWYPEYWEYTRWAASNYRSLQRWLELREEVLDCYLDESWVDDYLDSVFTRL